MCRKRPNKDPRVYYTVFDGQPSYLVEATGDDEFDQEHQDFVDAFFATGNGMDEFYSYCLDTDDYDDGSHDIVDCGHLTNNMVPLLKSPPTLKQSTVSVSIPSARTALRKVKEQTTPPVYHIPTPKGGSRYTPVIHHVTEAKTHECEFCGAHFTARNKLFTHLRTKNHWQPKIEVVPVLTRSGEITDAVLAPTPNDPRAESHPLVIKSTS
jgi:hypothetical protein